MLEHREVSALLALSNIRGSGWRRERPINNLNSAPSQENPSLAAADTRARGSWCDQAVTRNWGMSLVNK